MAPARSKTPTSTTAADGPDAAPRDRGPADGPREFYPDEHDQPQRSSNRPAAEAKRNAVPQDVVAEAALLNILLTTPAVFDDLEGRLSATDFFSGLHGDIYRAIASCMAQGRPLDPISVADELRRSGMRKGVDHHAAIDGIIQDTIAAASAESYTDIILDMSTRRRLTVAGREIISSAMDESAVATDVLADAEARILAVGNRNATKTMMTMAEGVERVIERISRGTGGGLIGMSTGLTGLDEMINGIQKRQMITIAARPGAGKTSLALQVCRHIADTTDQMVIFFSYEMHQEELIGRLLAADVGVPAQRLWQGNLPEGMYRTLMQQAERLQQSNLVLNDQPPETINGVRSEVRRLSRLGPIGAVAIDYIQLMSAERVRAGDNRNNEVSEISRGCKRMAQETGDDGVPVIALSQLSRAVETRPSKRPILADLRDSGCLAADTRITLADGSTSTIGDLYTNQAIGISILSVDEDHQVVHDRITNVFCSGVKDTYEMRLASNRKVTASGNHRFLTTSGWVRLDELTDATEIAVPRRPEAGAGVYWDEILSIQHVGPQEVFDATVETNHNFIANGIVAHNSVEQDSDVVAFVHRDSLYDDRADPREATIIIAKQRSGPTGEITVAFDGAVTKFSDQGTAAPDGIEAYQPAGARAGLSGASDRGGGFNTGERKGRGGHLSRSTDPDEPF